MKFAAVFVLVFVAAVIAGPINVSDNNVGDIVTVGINANVQLSNHIEQNIISVIIALLNQQVLGVIGSEGGAPADASKIQITPEMIERVRSLLTQK